MALSSVAARRAAQSSVGAPPRDGNAAGVQEVERAPSERLPGCHRPCGSRQHSAAITKASPLSMPSSAAAAVQVRPSSTSTHAQVRQSSSTHERTTSAAAAAGTCSASVEASKKRSAGDAPHSLAKRACAPVDDAAVAVSGAVPPEVDNSGKRFMMDAKLRLGEGQEYTRFKAKLKDALQVIKAATKSSGFTCTATSSSNGPHEQVLKALQDMRRLLSASALSAPPSLAPQLILLLPSAVQAEAHRILVDGGEENAPTVGQIGKSPRCQ